MTQVMSLVVGAVMVLCVGTLVFWQTQEVPVSEPVQNTNTENMGEPATGDGMTAAEVAVHNDATSCWSIINSSVCDLTSWIPKHPGGPQAILQLCGTDGSAKFNGQHAGGQMQMQILAGFKIGTLRN